jgi:CheY-like chemotaxis protein
LRAGVNWSNIRLLVVDDADEIRDYFQDIAERIGLVCDVANSGEEACRLIDENGDYDMYFVDWKMPGMDGVEFSRRVKARDRGNSVVIMISSSEWSSIEKEAGGAGVHKFLQKPLFPSTIADCVNECIGEAEIISATDATECIDMGCFAGRRVLLAEDVELNREIVAALLEPTELIIDCAENGAEALRMFSEAPDRYDMILMDVQMPVMSGYEATQRIRALDAPEAASVPIVAMTANVFREDVEKCLECGMNDHLGKPLDLNDVMSILRKYLRGAPAN